MVVMGGSGNGSGGTSSRGVLRLGVLISGVEGGMTQKGKKRSVPSSRLQGCMRANTEKPFKIQ